MKAIYRTPFFRTEVAAAYLKESSNDSIYCMLGREDNPRGVRRNGEIFNPGDGAWPKDVDPLEPLNSTEHDWELWDFSIAAKKLESTDMTFALNRYVDLGDGHEGSRLWADHLADAGESGKGDRFSEKSRVYIPIDHSSTNGDFVEETNCVLINEDREVFICVDRHRADEDVPWEVTHTLSTASDSINSDKVPSLNRHHGDLYKDNEYYFDDYNSLIRIDMVSRDHSSFDPEDHNHQNYYVWKYVCTLDYQMFMNFVSPQSRWIPINYFDVLGPTGAESVYTAESQDVKGDGYAPFILGLRYIIMRAFLPSSSEPGHGLPYGLNFRQAWFVKNPLTPDGDIATFTYGYMPNSISEMSPPLDSRYGDANHGQEGINTFAKYSGDIIYVEHRPTIFRQVDQTEEIFAVFSY